MTEQLSFGNGKILTLYFRGTTGLVSKLEVDAPNSRMRAYTHHFPYGATREEAIQQAINGSGL